MISTPTTKEARLDVNKTRTCLPVLGLCML
jgi:hypothetical protein